MRLLGLSVSVRPRKGFFEPVMVEKGQDFLGDVRLEGFAAAIIHGFVEHVTIVGGRERLSGETVESLLPFWRSVVEEDDEGLYILRPKAEAFWMVRHFGVGWEHVSWCESVGNTGGNVQTIKSLSHEDTFVSSNLYHLPRAMMDLYAANVFLPTVPAEALFLLRGADAEARLQKRLGETPLGRRMWFEAKGAHDKIVGRYKALSS